MKYVVSKASAHVISNLGMCQKISNFFSFLPQKTCMNPSFGVFFCTLRKKQRRKNSVSGHQLEGTLWPNGQSGGRFGG